MSKIFVGLSGGVDSAVSAAILKKEGHDVTGVFIKAWHPPFLKCDWRNERRDAMSVCAKLGIPFRTFDLEERYKKEVVDYMISEYAEGRTPNPDVMCNDKIKFGAFFSMAREEGAEFIATGHYARLKREAPKTKQQSSENKHKISNYEYDALKVKMYAGIDPNKDQSYFLWRVKQDVLQHVLFPIGDLTKSEVRDIANSLGLPVAGKKDSQGVCFLGHLNLKDFLKQFITIVPGDVLSESGETIGTHEGAHIYTLGQRHGFTVTKKTPEDGPFYVVDKDVVHNTITVSSRLKTTHTFSVSSVKLQECNWISGTIPITGKYEARFRYRQQLFSCEYDPDEMCVRFDEPQKSIALGQSLVLYKENEVIGGVVINAIL